MVTLRTKADRSSVDELRRQVAAREWFHTIDLGNGIVTPGIDDSPAKLLYLDLPASLAGRTVLDVGTYDGFFAFEAERRGAARVVAADHFCWSGRTGSLLDGRGFDIAHWGLHSRVEKRDIAVEDIGPETVGMFDYVLFLGVLYHSPDPFRYLRNVHSVTRQTAVIETHVDALDYPLPAMVLYPGDTLAGDPSNWWGPNQACVEHLCLEAGFTCVELVQKYAQRMVFHAHR